MSDPLAEALAELDKTGLDYWKAGKGRYRCPECESFNVARECNETKRYGVNGVESESCDVERIIRCMDCGTGGDEE